MSWKIRYTLFLLIPSNPATVRSSNDGSTSISAWIGSASSDLTCAELSNA
ncbi:hypothetical protein [Xanthomonas sp. GPE 39]|nr:hypothetical protein [Xanthomonas sp. GPE 39]